MSETTGNERVAGAPLTAAERAEVEQIEARWRKVEATSEFREMEARVEAHIDASRVGEGDDFVSRSPVSTPETAVERAAAMQQAREHAFTQQTVSETPAYETRRHAAATSTAEHAF